MHSVIVWFSSELTEQVRQTQSHIDMPCVMVACQVQLVKNTSFCRTGVGVGQESAVNTSFSQYLGI